MPACPYIHILQNLLNPGLLFLFLHTVCLLLTYYGLVGEEEEHNRQKQRSEELRFRPYFPNSFEEAM